MTAINTFNFSWNDIDTVCLDMDGTLLDLHFDNHFWMEYIPQMYADDNGLPLAQAKEYLYKIFAREHGKLAWYCLDFWTEKLKLDIVAHKAEVAHLISVRPGVLNFLEFVKSSEKSQYLVTNAHNASLKLKMTYTGIDHYFDEIICSHDFNLAKEEAGFWDRLASQYPLDLDRTLFIDDSSNVLQAAKKAGIKYVLGIAQPDSKQPAREIENVKLIHDFSDMIIS